MLFYFLMTVLLRGASSEEALDAQMAGIGVREAVVIASQKVDERPVWSPDGKYLAANVDGRWVRIAIDSLKLDAGAWHGGQAIGVAVSSTTRTPIDDKTARDWDRAARAGPRKVVTKDGTSIELRQEDLSTQFVVTRKSSKPEVRWSTGLENCHSLALSPDDRYVAFVCEQNGLIVATP